MQIKKELILIFSILLIVLQVINLGIIFMLDGQTLGDIITGDAASIGTASICINHPPTITTITNQTAFIGTAYSLQVTASDTDASDTLTYQDNTSLFNISSSGLISFTSVAGDSGNYTLLLNVNDNSGCTNYQTNITFALEVSGVIAEKAVAEAPAAAAGGGGGGGGGGSRAVAASFSVSEEIIKVVLKQSKKLEKKIAIRNDDNVNMKFEIINPLSHVLTIYPTSFVLKKDEEREISFTFNILENAIPNVYAGAIEITGNTGAKITKKEIIVVLEIESEEVLYDSSIDITKKILHPGENLRATISVFDLRRQTPADVALFYTISDMQNNIVFQGEETINLDGQASFSKDFTLPENLSEGQYLFSVKIPFYQSFATATELFTVEVPAKLSTLAGLAAPISKRPSYVLAIPLMFLLIIAIGVTLLFVHRRIKKVKKGKTIVQQKTIIKHRTIIKPETIFKKKTIIQKIFQRDYSETRRKLALLKEGYRKGYIKEETYRSTKAKLEGLMRE